MSGALEESGVPVAFSGSSIRVRTKKHSMVTVKVNF